MSSLAILRGILGEFQGGIPESITDRVPLELVEERFQMIFRTQYH